MPTDKILTAAELKAIRKHCRMHPMLASPEVHKLLNSHDATSEALREREAERDATEDVVAVLCKNAGSLYAQLGGEQEGLTDAQLYFASAEMVTGMKEALREAHCVCSLCHSPAYFDGEKNEWRHLIRAGGVIVCDKYGYPIDVVRQPVVRQPVAPEAKEEPHARNE
jgi:hypothetical protein